MQVGEEEGGIYEVEHYLINTYAKMQSGETVKMCQDESVRLI